MVVIINCNEDFIHVDLPYGDHSRVRIHKLHMGLIIVIIDMLSVLICHYIFSTTQKMNNDFTEIMATHVIKMSSFVTTVKHL